MPGNLFKLLLARPITEPDDPLPGDYPLGVIGRTEEEAAWDAQYTSGLSDAGSVVAATTGNISGASEDAVSWFMPAGTYTVSNKSFGKPVFVDGSANVTFINCSFAVQSSGSTGFDFFVLAINTNSGTTAVVTLEDCYLDLTNVGLTRAAGIYHAGGTLNMTRCKVENAAANAITIFQSASACTIVDTWFKRFGRKAYVDPENSANNTHCEPIHHRAGTLIVTRSFFDNREGTNPAATTTSASVYTEASAVTIAATMSNCVVDGTTEAAGPYAVVVAERSAGQATMTINGGAFEPGSSGFIDKGAGTVLAGSNSLNIDTGDLFTPSYG